MDDFMTMNSYATFMSYAFRYKKNIMKSCMDSGAPRFQMLLV